MFNIVTTHESRIRATPEEFQKLTASLTPWDRHDPAGAPLSPYYPDTPLVRRDMANYYDLVTAMDYEVGRLLRELERDGLADNTVVFYYGDHGRGLTRAKYWIYDSGIHIPLLIRWPGKIIPGTVVDRMVSGIDFGPTVLSITGLKAPPHMQGAPFLGRHEAPPRRYIFAARDRIDETYDIIRCARDELYKYIRNHQPCKPYAQYMFDQDRMPTMQEMRRLHFEAVLRQKRLEEPVDEGPMGLFFTPEKPPEELYDVTADPHEIRNLAGHPKHRAILERMRKALDDWTAQYGDLGMLPEAELERRWRPDGNWSVTVAPVIHVENGPGGGPARATITCETEGASTAWTTDPSPNARWRLYSGPITLERGARLRAVACRLGYQESPETISAPAGGSAAAFFPNESSDV